MTATGVRIVSPACAVHCEECAIGPECVSPLAGRGTFAVERPETVDPGAEAQCAWDKKQLACRPAKPVEGDELYSKEF